MTRRRVAMVCTRVMRGRGGRAALEGERGRRGVEAGRFMGWRRGFGLVGESGGQAEKLGLRGGEAAGFHGRGGEHDQGVRVLFLEHLAHFLGGLLLGCSGGPGAGDGDADSAPAGQAAHGRAAPEVKGEDVVGFHFRPDGR